MLRLDLQNVLESSLWSSQLSQPPHCFEHIYLRLLPGTQQRRRQDPPPPPPPPQGFFPDHEYFNFYYHKSAYPRICMHTTGVSRNTFLSLNQLSLICQFCLVGM